MTTEEQSGKGGNDGKEVKNEEGNVPFMISEMQREMNARCTQLQLNFKREHEENVKEKEKMRDSIERLTKIKDDLMKSLTLMTKERDSFREKAMGEKLLRFPSLNIKEEKRDERDDFYDTNTEINDDDDEFKEEEEEYSFDDDGGKNNEDTQTLVSRARFQKLQAELMIYREAAAKYRKEKEVALSKLEKYERKQQQQQQQRQQKRGGGKEENTAKRKRPHSPASKYAGDEMNDVDDEYSARKKNDKKTDDDEKSFSFNRTEDFWAFDKKNETTIKSNAFVNPQRQQQQQQQHHHHQTDKPKPKKHVDASKMMIMSKRASLDVGASKKGTAAASTAAKKGVSKKVRGLWNDAMKKKTTTISDTKTPPPPRSGAMFETPKTNEAQINENTPGEEEVLVIKNTQEEEEKEEKEVKRTKQELREDHQQKSNKCLPVDKPLREVKYQEVVRGKEARKELIGYACQECERFYAVAGQLDRRACEHGSNALNNNTNNGAPPINLENSRHRAKYVPPKDPAGYWDLGGFTQTQPDPKKRKATKFDETPPSQENL
ncbi:unnamed protein product [Bathycoccus prasinos]